MSFLDFFKSREKKVNETRLYFLLTVMFADKKIREEELTYLRGKALAMGFSVDEVTGMIKKAKKGDAGDLTFPDTPTGRGQILVEIVAMMMSDNDIDIREMNLCRTIARRLGFDGSVIDDIVRLAGETAKEGIGPEVGLDRIAREIGR